MSQKFTQTKGSAGNPTVTTVSAARSIGGTSLTATALTNWPLDLVDFITYKKNADGTKDNSSQLDWRGTVASSTSITGLTLVNGSDAGNVIGDFVEMGPTANWGQNLYDGLIAEHNNDGTHGDITPSSVTTPSLTVSSSLTLPNASVKSSNISASMIVGQTAANSTLNVTETDISGSSLTVNYASAVTILITFGAELQQTTAGHDSLLYLNIDGVDVASCHEHSSNSVSVYEGRSNSSCYRTTLASGNHTIKLTARTGSGGGGSANSPFWFGVVINGA